MCPAAGPLPRSIVLGKTASPPVVAHVIGTVFSHDAPYAPTPAPDLPSPEWVLKHNEALGVLQELPNIEPDAPATSADFQYESDVDVDEFHRQIRTMLCDAPENGQWEGPSRLSVLTMSPSSGVPPSLAEADEAPSK